MPIAPRPARSLLFVPGNREAWMEKALGYGADALIFDLEDAVPPAELAAARGMVRRFVETHGVTGPLVFVRVGIPGTPEIVDDIAAIVRPGLYGIMLPLVRNPQDVKDADEQITVAERANGMDPGSTVIVPLLETAEALRLSYEIATASPRVAHMGAGVSRQGDIVRALGYRWTAEGLETLYYRSMVLLNMRAAGIAYPMSGVWGDVPDLEGLRLFCAQSRDIGFAGMMVIHPSHIAIANETFTPTAAEIAGWQRTIAKMAEVHSQGWGTTTLDGELIDWAHVKTAEQGLELARTLGIRTEGSQAP